MKKLKRKTKETEIEAELLLLGKGSNNIDTPVGFFNHMLESFSKHSLVDLNIKAIGDTHIDDHHTVEDIGIVLGLLLNKAVFPIEKVERFGSATIVMDEASVSTDIDLSNRPFLVFDSKLDEVLTQRGSSKVGSFDTELVKEFFQSLVFNFKITAHITFNRGENKHHIIEAVFKSFAVALRRALSPNSRIAIPSTKGVL
jgi:imidazoleglycerol-phosphate dehydratase